MIEMKYMIVEGIHQKEFIYLFNHLHMHFHRAIIFPRKNTTRCQKDKHAEGKWNPQRKEARRPKRKCHSHLNIHIVVLELRTFHWDDTRIENRTDPTQAYTHAAAGIDRNFQCPTRQPLLRRCNPIRFWHNILTQEQKKKKRDLFLLAHARRRIKRHGGRKDSPPQPWHGLQKWSQNRTAGKSSRATFPWRCDRNVPSRKCPPFPLSFLFLHFPPQIYHSSVV